MFRYLIVDGMVSGTGIRNLNEEIQYIKPESLGISSELIEKLNTWHSKYKEQFYQNYADENVVCALDLEGIEISKAILNELKNCKLSYFSDAKLTKHIVVLSDA